MNLQQKFQRWQRLDIFWKFTISSIIAFAILGGLIMTFVPSAFQSILVNQQRAETVVQANRLAILFLRADDLSTPVSADARIRLEMFGLHLQAPAFIGATFYNSTGEFIYEFGRGIALPNIAADPNFTRVVNQNISVAEFRTLKPEQKELVGTTEIFSLFVPITFGKEKKTDGVLHVISRTGFIRSAIAETQRALISRLILGLIIIYGTLSLVIFGASRTIHRQASDLEREKNKLAIIAQNMEAGAILLDPSGEVIFANETSKKIVGIEGKSDRHVLPAFYTKFSYYSPKQLVAQCVAGLPVEIPEAETKEKTFRITMNCLRSGGGEIFGHLIWMLDVTEQKEIDRMRSEIISVAAHQLRTPPTIINWYGELLRTEKAGTLSEKQKGYLGEIDSANRRMIGIINALLNVSRIETGTFAIEPQPANITHIYQSALKDFEYFIKQKELVFTEKIDKTIPIMPLDLDLTRLIFHNIISNAVKYTQSGGKIDVEISMTKGPPVGGSGSAGQVLIKVADSGVGIPKAQQHSIFTKLFRADNVREVDPEGTGLGLYIVKSILDIVGGRIWFESPSFVEKTSADAKALTDRSEGKEENKGTTFYVTIPLEGMPKRVGSRRLTY